MHPNEVPLSALTSALRRSWIRCVSQPFAGAGAGNAREPHRPVAPRPLDILLGRAPGNVRANHLRRPTSAQIWHEPQCDEEDITPHRMPERRIAYDTLTRRQTLTRCQNTEESRCRRRQPNACYARAAPEEQLRVPRTLHSAAGESDGAGSVALWRLLPMRWGTLAGHINAERGSAEDGATHTQSAEKRRSLSL